MRPFFIATGIAALACLSPLKADKIADHDKRFRESAAVFGEIMRAPDKAFRAICWTERLASPSSRI